jgi:hypothetical protein
MFKHLKHMIRRKPRGQGFIELLLVTVILALLLTGVVEFGFMLNHYMHVLDGAREAARYSSTQLAFDLDSTGQPAVDGGGNIINNRAFYYLSAAKASETMDVIILNPANGDDIVISVFSVSGVSIARFPSADGWSLCRSYASFAAYFTTIGKPIPVKLTDAGWSSGCTPKITKFRPADILGRMEVTAPPTGILLVEIFYGYPQTLKLPFFSGFDFLGTKLTVIPDPIPLYVYTVMPLSSAEPTIAH